MEQYISQLSDCQLREAQLRAEREALLKRHERELEELDGRLAAISTLRTTVIEDFKHFLDSPALMAAAASGSAEKTGKSSKVLLRAESAEASIGVDDINPTTPPTNLLTVDTSCDGGKVSAASSLCSTPSPTYHSASHSPNPNYQNLPEASTTSPAKKEVGPVSAASELPTKALLETEKPVKPTNKSGRSFKFVHRLAMSKSAGSIPTAITVASPTTTAIESMLFKVKENVHSLDDQTLNQCIDLLSSRILKDKETGSLRTSVLSTPDILGPAGDFSGRSGNLVKKREPEKREKRENVSKSSSKEGNNMSNRIIHRPAPIRQNAQSGNFIF